MASPHHLPNRSPLEIGIVITATILSTTIAIWRLIVRFRINPRLGWSDWFMIPAVCLAMVAHVFAILSAQNGEGRVDADPFIHNKAQMTRALMFMFYTRCFNIYALFFAKVSICCYLLALNFSKTYRILIWISLFLVVTLTGIFPTLSLWAFCTPIRSRWNVSVKGHCIGGNGMKWASQYIQTVTTIVTDVLYAAAPIIYIRRVQLSRYTRIGVQGVFLCSLLGTGISIGKVIEFRRAYGKPDQLYKSSSSTMLSVSENSIAIIVGCLPPLRRTFDDFLKKVLPESVLTAIGASQPRSQNNNLPSYYSKGTRSGVNKSGAGTGDDESELAILPDEEYMEDASGKIVRTTRVTVRNERVGFGEDGMKGV